MFFQVVLQNFYNVAAVRLDNLSDLAISGHLVLSITHVTQFYKLYLSFVILFFELYASFYFIDDIPFVLFIDLVRFSL